MKTVFNNSMLAHVWAQQTQSEGRSNNGQFYFRDKTIYSYRDSWPLAHFHKSGLIILNTQSYSMTTSAHLSEVRSALGYGNPNIVPVDSVEVVKDIVNGYGTNQDTALKVCKAAKAKAHEFIKSAAKRKKPSLQARDIGTALIWISTAETLCDALESGVQFHTELGTLQTQLREDSAALIASKGVEIKEEREKELQRKKERQAAAKEKHDIELAKFRAGNGYNGHWLKEYTDTIYMRVMGDDIETSRGAVFPVSHAAKAFKVLRALKERGEAWQRNGHTIHLGHFQIDKVDAKGNVTAGCHYVEWPEIERTATKLKIYP